MNQEPFTAATVTSTDEIERGIAAAADYLDHFAALIPAGIRRRLAAHATNPKHYHRRAAKLQVALRAAGPQGLTRTQLTRGVFSGQPAAAVDGLLEPLLDSGTVVAHSRVSPEGGRPATVYILAELLEFEPAAAEPPAAGSLDELRLAVERRRAARTTDDTVVVSS